MVFQLVWTPQESLFPYSAGRGPMTPGVDAAVDLTEDVAAADAGTGSEEASPSAARERSRSRTPRSLQPALLPEAVTTTTVAADRDDLPFDSEQPLY